MATDVDLRQLAIDRSSGPKLAMSRHIGTRYLLPAALVVGFLSLVLWASRDFIWPPKHVTVIPVLASRAEVQQAGATLFKAAGWIQPRPTPIRVAALSPGVVKQLLVVEDQPLKAGQTVARLVDEDAQLELNRVEAKQALHEAELQQAEATLTAAKTRLEQPVHLKALVATAESKLAKVETELQNLPFELRRAIARQQFAKKDYKGKLAAKGAISGRTIDSAKTELDTTAALVEELRRRSMSLEKVRKALQQNLAAVDKRLELLADERRDKGQAEAAVAAAKARLKQIAVEMEECQLRLSRMTIRAPMAGRVYQLLGHPGARVGEGSGMGIMAGHDGSTVVTMYRPDRLQVRVDVRFEDISLVQLQQEVRIENPALKKPIYGKVLFVSSLVDIQKNTNEVKVAIVEASNVFKPDMLVDVTFLAAKREASENAVTESVRLYVPKTLVKQEDGRDWIWIADQSTGQARRVNIALGDVTANGMVLVVKGLNASNRLIVSGVENLADRSRIKVTGEATDYFNYVSPSKEPPSAENGSPNRGAR